MIEFISNEKNYQLLIEFNDTKVDYPKNKTIIDLFEEQVEKKPDDIAVVFKNTELTYKELNGKANQLAGYLRNNYAIEPDDLVGIKLDRSEYMIIALLGVLKSGAAYIPIDPSYPEERIAYIESDSNANIIVDNKELSKFLETRNDYSNENLEYVNQSSNLICCIYTFGSTGLPKGVKISNDNLNNRLNWMWQKFPFERNEVGCITTSIGFVDHLWELFGPLLKGIKTVIYSKETLLNFNVLLEKLIQDKITRIVLVPTLLKNILEYIDENNIQLIHLKYWTSSGEKLSMSLVHQFYKIFKKHKLLNIYGSTEVTADVLCYDTSKLLVKNIEEDIFVPKLFSNLPVDSKYYQLMIEDVFEKKIITNNIYDVCLGSDDFEESILEKTVSLSEYNDFLANQLNPNLVNVYSKKFIGHMTGPVPPIMQYLQENVTKKNLNLVKYETAGAGIHIERQVIKCFHQLIFNNSDDFYSKSTHDPNLSLGIFTNGGTLSNITALSFALSKKLNGNETEGINNIGLIKALQKSNYSDIVILAPSLCHYSIQKAAKILGLGMNSVVKFELSSDNSEQNKAEMIEEIESLQDQNILILAIIGVAGATESGEIDDLSLLAEIAHKYEIHFHVDAAFGGAFVFSDTVSKKIKGIEKADTVTICGHKQLYVPIGNSMLLFNNPEFGKFSENNSDYQARKGSNDLGKYTIEGTRSFSTLLLHGAIKIVGKKGYEEILDDNIRRAELFYDLLFERPEFQVYKKPELNILLYRYIPVSLRQKLIQGEISESDEMEINEINEKIQSTQFQNGNSFVSYTKLKRKRDIIKKVWLRTVFMNPFTTEEDLKSILDEQVEIIEENKNSSSVLLIDSSIKEIPIGTPISNTKVYILDENLILLPIGVPGKIYISGLSLSSGYLNQPELTKEKFLKNPFEEGQKMYDTGDLGRWLPDGNIEFLGRKDQVKIRGFRTELGEIENTILQFSDFLKQVVVEVKEINNDKVLVAYFVSTLIIDKSQLRSFIETKLPDYMIPSFYVELEELPLTPNGKIDRKALPSVDGEDLIRKEYVAPRNETEESLVAIWNEVLAIEKIGITDNFFELGGHSLILVQVVNRVYKQLGKTISFQVFFANPTIKELSKQLKENEYLPIPKATQALSYPLTASQNRFWIMSQLQGGSLAYNMPAAVKLTGVVDFNKFDESFKLLIHRHEILRTYFKSNEEGEIQQYILPSEQVDFKIVTKDFSIKENPEDETTHYLEEINNIPFDLEQAPLVRNSLIKLKEEEYVFFLSLHHIISDGWSIRLLISEVVKTYNNLIAGRTIDLPELSIQYKDYAVWLNTSEQHQKNQKSEQYWLQQFEGELPVLDLPSSKARPLIKTYNGDSLPYQFPKAFLDKLKSFSKDHDVTLFMTLMAGINGLLYRYTGQDDIILGTPIAGREHPDLENQLGLYLNKLAIRTSIKRGGTFSDLINSQKENLLAAYDHQNYPFDELVGKLNLKRDMSRSALFDVLVVLQNRSQLNNLNSEELIGLEVSGYNFSRKKSQFDVGFTFVETEGLGLVIEYNTDIYDKYLIQRMFVHFENLLQELIKNPERKIQEIDYLTEQERQQLLVEFNDTKVDYPQDKMIIDLFEEQVAKTPDNIAVVYKNTELTYEELNSKANQLAGCLRENYAIEPDDLVGIKLDRSEDMIITILGILKSGAAYVPIDPAYPKERIAYIENDSNSKIVIDKSFLDLFVAVQDMYSKENIEKINRASDLAYVIYTSGTTGNPKGVMIENRSLCNYINWCSNFYFEKEGHGSFGLFSSLSFDLTITSIFLPLIRGNKIKVFENNLNAHEVLLDYTLDSNTLDIIKLTPSHLELLKVLDLKGIALKKIIVGGESLVKRQVDEIFKQSNETNIYNEYGPTESTVGCIVKKISENTQITIGKPISNTQIYILDESLQLLPMGVSGKIYVSGSGVARGYLNKPELTAEKFISNPFIEGSKMYDTGDLARWLPNGEIEFLGRKDHQVKIRGFRIELGEIENTILQFSNVLKQVVVEVKEINNDKVLVAYFVSTLIIDKSQLRSFLETKLPDYMVPSFYVALEELPLTPNGKIDRKALPSVDGKDLIRNEYVAPRNKTEESLAVIWQEVLAIEKIGITDNLFELGGHSLIVAQVINRTYKILGKSISFRDLFYNPTIEGLIKLLANSSYVTIPTAPESDSYPLTPSQNTMWIMNQFDKTKTHRMSTSINFKGYIDVPKFEEAFRLLIHRHEILRTFFKINKEGDIRQYIMPQDQVNFTILKLDYSFLENKEDKALDYLKMKDVETFDLGKGPLLHATIIKLEQESILFYLSIHHIIGDGWSMKLLTSEAMRIYNALINNQKINLPDLKIQYKDYAVWLNEDTQQEKLLLSEKYWLNQFAVELPVLDLPSFKTRPSIKTHNGATFNHQFSEEFLEMLKTFSNEQGITLFMTLMAGINILLHFYTDQDDIIIGTGIAGREHPDLENQIGLYMNTLAIRTKFEEGDSFLDFIMKQKEILLNAYEHQIYPFDSLIDKLNLKRDLSRSVLFDVFVHLKSQVEMINLNNKEYLTGVYIEPNELELTISLFDILFEFYETPKNLSLRLIYNTDIYDSYFIERIFTHFENLMTKLINEPEKNIL
ncbi:amino acid adenylation domain-containing protein [Flavobacterium sp. ZB4P13]|uniref:amino acid adenylation domain-containing protein n=1 Tax=Flavobacterium sp. ZB4P13 TaxID=3401728 RepID=UPI003AAC9E2E